MTIDDRQFASGRILALDTRRQGLAAAIAAPALDRNRQGLADGPLTPRVKGPSAMRSPGEPASSRLGMIPAASIPTRATAPKKRTTPRPPPPGRGL